MRWVRDRRKFGAWAALFAFAVQIVLSFGHVHVGKINAPTANATVAWQNADSDAPSSPGHPPGAHDYCAICATISMVASASLPEPARIMPPAAESFVWLHEFAVVPPSRPAHDHFQARAPPVVG